MGSQLSCLEEGPMPQTPQAKGGRTSPKRSYQEPLLFLQPALVLLHLLLLPDQPLLHQVRGQHLSDPAQVQRRRVLRAETARLLAGLLGMLSRVPCLPKEARWWGQEAYPAVGATFLEAAS